jgi:hypothetical protein
MICSHCQNPAHLDFEDRSLRCNPCHRSPAFCRCTPVAAERVPIWLQRSRERTGGLVRDLTGVA